MLLYCMTEADAAVGTLSPGVREAEMESLAEHGVRCFYSRVEDLGANAESFRADALRFHAVLREILDRAAVAPFRFPTLLESEGELREFLAGEAPAYVQDLQRLRGMVQMEVRIRPDATLPDTQSGKEYMEGRAAETRTLNVRADAVRAAAKELITEWHTRRESGGLRCYALIPREQVADFEQRVRALSPVEGASIMVSGPWPASEFLHVGNQD
jgi:gas vesicle protein GvpL/GvpF